MGCIVGNPKRNTIYMMNKSMMVIVFLTALQITVGWS